MKKRYGAIIFLVAMAVALAGCYLLINNRQAAVTQAKAIVTKDQAGTDITTDQIKLKAFAASHMKVNVVYVLQGSYDRAVAEAKAKANSSNAMYAAAQASCDKRGVDSIRQSQCVAAYIAANGQVTTDVKLPNVADYTYQIAGPAWTFDAAGLAFVVAAILAVTAIIGLVHRVVTK